MFKTNFMPLFEATTEGATTTTATTTATTTGKPWYDGVTDVTPEYIGMWQTMGLDKKSPAEAARDLSKSYLEARKFIGVPENQLLRMPKDAADEQGWQALRTRLGVPTDPKQYDEGLKVLKKADGQPVDQTFVDLGRELAHKLHLPAADAPALVQGVMAHLDRQSELTRAEATRKVEEGRAEIKRDWGANFDANKLIASNALAKLGFKPEVWAALEQTSSYKDVMTAALKIGQMTGEDKLVLGNVNGSPSGPMTVDQAKFTKAELMRDTAWVAKHNAGDREAIRQMLTLNALISGYTGELPKVA